EQHRFEPDVVSRASQLSTLQQLVAAGRGVAMIPAMAAASLQSPSVVLRPVADDPPYREVAIAWRPNRRFTPQLDGLLEVLRRDLPPAG
ncbi:MAG: LysR family transcriptional regulator substrate-binding protein, partial [Planctomycetota bacterium]